MAVNAVPRWQWRNVPLPEPHLGLLALGLFLHYRWPQTLAAERRIRHVSGCSLLSGGALFAGWATWTAGNTDLADPRKLIGEGPYALSRHPMYIGWTAIYLGLALVANTSWLILLAPLLLVLVHRSALAEERRLEEIFGDSYRDYRERARRYL